MRNKRMRAFLITLLVYALVGPLIGLLCIVVISVLVGTWGPVVDRLGALLPQAQSSSCAALDPGHLDLRCFQRFEPRQFWYPGLDLQWLSLEVFGAYMLGFFPALLAGLLICADRLRDGGGVFRHAVLIGVLTGLITGVTVIFRPEVAILLFSLCLTATIVCWLVTRPLWPEAGIVTPDRPDSVRSGR